MPRRRRVLAALLTSQLALATSLIASEAHAGDIERARTLFDEGVRLYKSGDWEGARRAFREADTEHHAPGIVYNLGLAEEKLGHSQAAVDAYEAYLAEAGAKGDLATAAASAVAQLKARSTRLRLESRPPGARIFVDGSALAEPAPVNVLVPAGHHVLVAQGDGWRQERDIEVRGAGDVVTVVLEQDVKPEVPAPALPPVVAATPMAPPPPPVVPRTLEETPDGLVYGAAFAIVPAYLLGVTTAGASNARPALSIVAGPLLEIGYALNNRFEILARGLAGIGPDGKPSWAFMGGPALSYRVGSAAWLGAAFIGGQLETKAHGARYGTDQVFGAMLEAGIVVIKKPTGEWLAGAQPGFLLTEMRQDNTTFFVPLTFGYRGY